jgi:hypothetical protein
VPLLVKGDQGHLAGARQNQIVLRDIVYGEETNLAKAWRMSVQLHGRLLQRL